MDDIDRANAQAERWLNSALAVQLHRAVAPQLAPKFCLNCQAALPLREEPLQPVQRWCDADCQSDWSRRQ